MLETHCFRVCFLNSRLLLSHPLWGRNHYHFHFTDKKNEDQASHTRSDFLFFIYFSSRKARRKGIRRLQRERKKNPRGKAIKEDLGENRKRAGGLRLYAVGQASSLPFASTARSAVKSPWLLEPWTCAFFKEEPALSSRRPQWHKGMMRLLMPSSHSWTWNSSSRLVGVGDWQSWQGSKNGQGSKSDPFDHQGWPEKPHHSILPPRSSF